jgi:hypothetical protein
LNIEFCFSTYVIFNQIIFGFGIYGQSLLILMHF